MFCTSNCFVLFFYGIHTAKHTDLCAQNFSHFGFCDKKFCQKANVCKPLKILQHTTQKFHKCSSKEDEFFVRMVVRVHQIHFGNKSLSFGTPGQLVWKTTDNDHQKAHQIVFQSLPEENMRWRITRRRYPSMARLARCLLRLNRRMRSAAALVGGMQLRRTHHIATSRHGEFRLD